MPVAEIPLAKRVRRRHPHRPLSRRLLVSFIRLVVVLVLGALGGGGWYLAKKGFGREWRTRVVEELRKNGVEASVRRLTLDPFRGLIAQDVKIFDYKNRENVIAEISRISLDVNYAALLQHQSFLNAIDIRNAQVALPLPDNADPKSPRAEIKNLHAHIYFPPEQIYVSQADGIFGGIRVSVTGQLIKRNDYKPARETTHEEWQARLQLLQRIVSELTRFRSTAPPRLQLKFTGDVAQLENARVEGTFQAEEWQRGAYQMRRLRMVGEFADQTLTISQCDWQDRLGVLNAGAIWQRESGELELQARSTLDLRTLIHELGVAPVIADLNFAAPPRLDLSLHARLGEGAPQWQATGRLAFDRFFYKNIPFNNGRAEFAWDGARTMLRDVHVRHASGEFIAQLLDAPNDFRLDLASTIDANALRSLAPADMRDFINDWEWPHASNLQLTIRGQSRQAATWHGDGTLQLERGRYRTVGFNSATSEIHFGNGAVTYQNFRITRDEGVASGTFIYDFAHHETRFTNVRSNVRPSEGILWVDPTMLKAVTPYKFSRPPNVVANGVYQFHGGKNTRIEVSIDSPGTMEYVFLGKTLPFDRINARLLFTNDRLQILDLNGVIFSGKARGSADISLAKNDQRYRASASVEGIDFPKFTELYFNYHTAQGFMKGHFDWQGAGDEARAIVGEGGVEVRNGDVFAIPVFGPLSDLLDKMMPGAGYRVARKASLSFAIKDGVIRTSDFNVDAGGFGMIGHGDSHFLENKIDFDVRINASGAGYVLTPLYKFFEYKAEGALNHPTWRAKNF